MKKLLITGILFLCFTGFVYSKTGDVIINRIVIIENEKNITSINTIKSFLKIHEGDIFISEDDLFTALENQKQALNNTRYFSTVEITAEATEVPGRYDIVILYEDGWTFVPIPYPIPDSGIGNNGWSFGLEINYDNFFGTMTDFYFDGYANIAFGEADKLKEWKVGPKISNIRIGDLILSAEYIQKYKTTEVTDPARAEAEQLLQHYTNHESSLIIGTSFDLGSDWSYSINPEFGFKYSFDYHDMFEGLATQENNQVIEDRVNIVIGHKIEISDVNWIGPLRDGYAVELTNNLRFLNSYDNETAVEAFRFVTDFELLGRLYKTLGDHFNYYTRAIMLGIINDYDTGLGSKLRGVKDSSMYGDLGVFWQNTLAIEIIGLESFHFQMHPFVDAGLAFYTGDFKPIQDVFRIGFGSDVVFMLGSVDIKATIGYDPVSDYIDFSFATGLTY